MSRGRATLCVRSWIPVALVLMLSVACTGNPFSARSAVGNQSVDAAGALVAFDGGSLLVPPGALDGPTEVSVVRSPPTDGSVEPGPLLVPVGERFEVQLAGARPSVPMELTLAVGSVSADEPVPDVVAVDPVPPGTPGLLPARLQPDGLLKVTIPETLFGADVASLGFTAATWDAQQLATDFGGQLWSLLTQVLAIRSAEPACASAAAGVPVAAGTVEFATPPWAGTEDPDIWGCLRADGPGHVAVDLLNNRATGFSADLPAGVEQIASGLTDTPMEALSADVVRLFYDFANAYQQPDRILLSGTSTMTLRVPVETIAPTVTVDLYSDPAYFMAAAMQFGLLRVVESYGWSGGIDALSLYLFSADNIACIDEGMAAVRDVVRRPADAAPTLTAMAALTKVSMECVQRAIAVKSFGQPDAAPGSVLGTIGRAAGIISSSTAILYAGMDTAWRMVSGANHLPVTLQLARPGLAPTPTTPGPRPGIDLRVDRVVLTGPLPCAGSNLDFAAHIANRGTADSGRFAMRWSADGRFDDGETELPAGTTDVPAPFTWREVPPGQHTLTYTMDFDGRVGETNEANNIGSLTFTAVDCEDRDIVPGPDLEVVKLSKVNGSLVCAGSSPTFTATVQNGGAADSGPFRVRWNADGALEDGGPVDLRAGTRQVWSPYRWEDIPPGVHNLIFTVDVEGQVAEFDEGNNSEAMTFMAVDCPRGGTELGVDVEVTDIENDGTVICANATESFSVFLRNNGPRASGPFTGRWNADGRTENVGSIDLPAGAEDIRTGFEWRNIPLGLHALTFTADVGEDVDEFDETNNYIAMTFEAIDCTDPKLNPAGIDIQAIDIEFDEPVCAGGSPSFITLLQNNGSVHTGLFNIRWNLDGRTVDGAHSSITPGARDAHVIQWADIPAGLHTVTFTADVDDRVAETVEGNNYRAISFVAEDCTTPPERPTVDLVVESLTNGDSLICGQSSSPVFTATIRNVGTTTSAPFTLRWTAGAAQSDSTVGGLDPGSAVVRTYTWATVPGGDHSIEATADPEGAVAESDEQNNVRSTAFTAQPCNVLGPGPGGPPSAAPVPDPAPDPVPPPDPGVPAPAEPDPPSNGAPPSFVCLGPTPENCGANP